MAGTRQQGRANGRNEADYEDRLEGYKFVDQRIVEFYEKYPEGALRLLKDPELIVVEIDAFDADGNRTGTTVKRMIRYVAGAFANLADEQPKGIGVADEPFPGRTPYTKDSEVMNAETSAWGRAIVAAGIISKGDKVASANEVMHRRREDGGAAPAAAEANVISLSDKQKACLTLLAANTEHGKKNGEDWARDTVEKRFQYHLKKGKEAQAAFDATLAELQKAHEASCGPDDDHITAALAQLAEGPQEKAAEEAA